MTTEKEQIARCGIYETRPEVCRVYPKVDHYIPSECTYTFAGPERGGDCSCNVGACCSTPREGGEPGGTPMPNVAGGEPCRHLIWVYREVEKTASTDCAVEQPTNCSICDLVGGPRDT